MMVSTRGSVLRILLWQWKSGLLFGGAAFLITLLHEVYNFEWVTLPGLPLAVVGGAIGIFVSFRSNSAYDRWWEGRKLWGRMVNVSRQFSTEVQSYLAPKKPDEARLLVRRHIAYVHALRVLLRLEDPRSDADLKRYTDVAPDFVWDRSSPTHALVDMNFKAVTASADHDELSEDRLRSFDESFREMLNVQGGCERIKKTPFPLGYGFIANRLVLAFGCLFPLAIVDTVGWLTVPINLLVTLAFVLISEAGRVLEDPFSTYYNGLPLLALSRTIENNLLEEIGENELPPIPRPNEAGILL